MSCCDSPLGQYLAKNGGHFHPDLEYRTDSFGTSIYSSTKIPPHTSVVSCPFALAVTPTIARNTIACCFLNSEILNSLNDHELMCSYLCLHLIYTRIGASDVEGLGLEHWEYVESLPKEEDMRTPSYFSEEEISLLRGTNLWGAAKDRLEGWKVEWEAMRSKLKGNIAERYNWNYYLYACTIISSRAFPSSLISTSTLPSESIPILFPGVDTLNHKIGEKVTWNSDVHHLSCEGKGKGRLEIILDGGVEAHQQAFNTYGPKSNEELLLGYGFTTPSNPADSVILKLGALPSNPATSTITTLLKRLGLKQDRFSVGREFTIPKKLLSRLRVMLAQPEELSIVMERLHVSEKRDTLESEERWVEIGKFISWENEMQVLDSLAGMIQLKLAGILENDQEGSKLEGVRNDVRLMIEEYRNGQKSILKGAATLLDDMMEENANKALEAGVDLFDEDESESEE